MVCDTSFLTFGQKKKMASGEILFMAGEKASGFYRVVSGTLRAYQMDKHAREVEVARFGSGDFLAEIILFASECFPVTVEAIVDTEVLYFAKERILSEIRKNPEVAFFFLRLLARKCLHLGKRIETLNLYNVRQRLIVRLLELCPARKPYVIDLQITKSQLAKEMGTISATLSRNLRHLEVDRLICVAGSRIKILNRPALEKEQRLDI